MHARRQVLRSTTPSQGFRERGQTRALPEQALSSVTDELTTGVEAGIRGKRDCLTAVRIVHAASVRVLYMLDASVDPVWSSCARPRLLAQSVTPSNDA